MEFLTVHTPQAATERLQLEMTRFGKDKNQPVNLQQFGWENIWRELVNVGIYRRGPDVAEIGSTWLESMAAMGSLHRFSAQDLYQIGGKEIFLPIAWQSAALTGQKEAWGVPFRADVRVIFYWKDMFESASVDPLTAFSTIDGLAEAFRRLQATGIPAWIAPTDKAQNTVYNIASWIWGSGGDFLSDDGKRTALLSPAALQGVRAYFDLLRFMPKLAAPFTDSDTLHLFFGRRAASMVAGPWLLNSLRMQKDMEAWLPYLGVAPMPGPSFIGGTLLVIWEHTKSPFNAVEFIKRLTSFEFQSDYCPASGLLPVRQDLWTDKFIHSDEYMPIFHQAISNGRALRPIALWGMVEEHLARTMAAIWQGLYTLDNPSDGLDDVIVRHFEALAARLDMTLAETGR